MSVAGITATYVLRYLLNISKNHVLDIWTLLQVSQNFRASDKYSFKYLSAIEAIFDKLEISRVSHQISSPQYLVCPYKLEKNLLKYNVERP